MKSLSNTIFYIKYFATKYGETIERKGTLDDKAKGEYVCKRGYPCFNYVDLNATEKFGKTQYRTASFKWEINEQPTMLNN